MNGQNSINPHKLFKNPENGILTGICAGIADYLGISTTIVRAIFIIGTLFLSPLFLIAYIVLAFVLDRKPVRLYETPDEETFWRSMRFTPRDTFTSLRHKFRTMEDRLRKMEDKVTSREFELENEYKNL